MCGTFILRGNANRSIKVHFNYGKVLSIRLHQTPVVAQAILSHAGAARVPALENTQFNIYSQGTATRQQKQLY